MKGILKYMGIMSVLILTVITGQAQQIAFPGADGWGRYASGGRGGAVIQVNNLNDNGAGSLRAAINISGPRTIVFNVSGTIFLKSDLKISKGDLTIAGQTAPGDGICLANFPLIIQADNVIIRYIRSRLGDKAGQEEDAFSVNGTDNIIIDHCTFSWSVDETASAYGNTNFTMQYCIISESLYHSIHSKGNHGYGGIWGGHKASFHHNLLAHHTSRLPRLQGARYYGNWDELMDHRNNVIYNWGFNSAYGGEPSEVDGNIARINMVKNYYKPGPATRTGELQYRIVSPDPDSQYGFSKWYVDSNEVAGHPGVLDDNWGLGVQGVSSAEKLQARTDTMFPYDMIFEETAAEAYLNVISNVGACLPRRDTIDRRIIWEVQNDTALYGGVYGSKRGIIDSPDEVGGWPELYSGPAPVDNDHDGMADSWELNYGLNPEDPEDRNGYDFGNGYTNLEEYLNSITEYPDFLRPPADLNLELRGLNHVLIEWTYNSDIEAGFILERSDTADFSIIATLPPNTLNYADSNLSFGQEYSYRLRGFTATDSSTYTQIRSITTLTVGSPPNKAYNPSPFHYENEISANPTLTWTAGNGAEFHRVYFGPSNPPDSIGEQTSNEFLPGELEKGSSYYWRIDEVNEYGTTAGTVWKFITEDPTSISENLSYSDQISFDIYPNPVTEGMAFIEYRLDKSSHMRISVIDLYGREILAESPGVISPGNHKQILNLEGIKDGVYLIIIHAGTSYKTIRIILSEK